MNVVVDALDDMQRPHGARPDLAHLAAAFRAVDQRGRREKQRAHGAVEEMGDRRGEGVVVEERRRKVRAVR